jgi:hypothetical protein
VISGAGERTKTFADPRTYGSIVKMPDFPDPVGATIRAGLAFFP